ncbi:hypothetical protein H0H81_008237 [Sphagnurus paluster]|uniref:TauD/TfdA-like domain-containing protein n=1 Tax=Sphagnurus paluster TaxID=117069 RepID=A0A9P7GKP6_9AGAR|nr:hypothetical protein H0H81_008237 [Sphagnurus paluster]
MSTTIQLTETISAASVPFHVDPDESKEPQEGHEPYRYAHLLPHFSPDHHPPLTPFEHVDPGHRALSHPRPRSFLNNATVVELTPNLGNEVHGVNLAELNDDARDQLALEYEDSITTTVWHSDVSYELQPPGLTTFFLLSQPTTGGDTLFTSQVSNLKKLSPQFVAFLRTLKAAHSGVEQANFSRTGRRGGVVRREPVENVHPVVRRHPVTGEEALYVNKQFTRYIVGLKREESGVFFLTSCISWQ